jgi:outer membrane lipoprotein carrier protein
MRQMARRLGVWGRAGNKWRRLQVEWYVVTTLTLVTPGLGLSGPSAEALVAFQPAAAETEVTEFAQRLQAHYDGVRDFSADFTHTYEGGVLRRKTSERGTVLIKKPGKMRWTYTAPEDKLFVSDGSKMYMWIPADRQVTVSPIPKGDQASTAILFLLGRGNLTRDFTVRRAAAPAGEGAPTEALALVPKTPVPEYDTLTLVVERDSLKLRSLIARDAQSGTSTFTFTNLRENVRIPDSRFNFMIPRGADVITP